MEHTDREKKNKDAVEGTLPRQCRSVRCTPSTFPFCFYSFTCFGCCWCCLPLSFIYLFIYLMVIILDWCKYYSFPLSLSFFFLASLFDITRPFAIHHALCRILPLLFFFLTSCCYFLLRHRWCPACAWLCICLFFCSFEDGTATATTTQKYDL